MTDSKHKSPHPWRTYRTKFEQLTNAQKPQYWQALRELTRTDTHTQEEADMALIKALTEM